MLAHAAHSMDQDETGVIGHYNPVNVSEALGIMILGVLAVLLLIALLRAQGRNRKLLTQLAEQAVEVAKSR